MIVKLQNGDKLKIESNEKREARRKYKEHSLLSIGLKLKRNLNIASNFLKAGPNITNFGNALSALFGEFSPENPDITAGEPPAVGIKNFKNLVRTARVAREFNDVVKGAVNLFKPGNRYKREDVLIGNEWGADLYTYPEYVQRRINGLSKIAPGKISKYNPEEFDHLFILDSDFTPMAKMNIGANLKGQLSEIVRRLNSLYDDVPLEVNNTIKLLENIPFVLGYFNNPGHSGMHSQKRNLSLVDPVPETNLPSNIMHEHIMHGTDKWMTKFIAEKYLNFVDLIMNNTNGTYKLNGWTYKIPEDTDKWYEGRATLGEIRKSIYDKLAKSKGTKITPETIELLRPEFEKIIDDLTIEEASELLIKTGGYGKVYGRLGPKNNPKFLLQFKDLMKIAPATIPFLIPRKEEKK